MAEQNDSFPRGLSFPGLQEGEMKRPLLVFLSVIALTGLALIWPVYPLASDITPYILGLPLSFFWVAAWLVVAFVALVFYYRKDVSE